MERATTLCEDDIITPEDIQLPTNTSPNFQSEQEPESKDVITTSTTIPKDPLEDYLVDKERKAIVAALEKTRWNKTAAAKLLGISFRQLRYRLKKLDLD